MTGSTDSGFGVPYVYSCAAFDDNGLASLARDGDECAQEVLYDRYHGPLYGFFYKRVLNHEVAEDLVSETATKAVLQVSSFESGSFREWIYQIARNTLIDHIRRDRQTVSLELVGESPDTYLAVPSAEDAIVDLLVCDEWLSALDQFSLKSRQVLMLRVSGRSVQEIADLLQMDITAIKSLQYRARRRLGGASQYPRLRP